MSKRNIILLVVEAGNLAKATLALSKRENAGNTRLSMFNRYRWFERPEDRLHSQSFPFFSFAKAYFTCKYFYCTSALFDYIL